MAALDSYVDDVVPLFWATPGVTRSQPPVPVLPSPGILALRRSLDELSTQTSAVDGEQARVDTEALLQAEQQLRVLTLQRVGDVNVRGLYEQAGFRSARSWMLHHKPDGNERDVSLAERLRDFPQVSAAVSTGRMTLRAAGSVTSVLKRCRLQLDRPDGLIDGQPGDAVVQAVLRHVAELLCTDVHGLHDDDPRLAVILARAEHELAEQLVSSQAQSLEAALTWLGEDMSSAGLPTALEHIVLAVLPSELDDRDKRGHERRSLTLTPLRDGSGWRLEGDLTLEAGERLWTALSGAAAVDPENPADTQAWRAAAQDLAADSGTSVPLTQDEPALLPRTRGHRMHDAFALVLKRYLDAGLGGMSGKAPVQVYVTVRPEFLTGAPGAMPPVADSGALIPRRLLKKWWSDSKVTAFVLSLGGKALRVVHGQRTLTADERRALHLEGGGRCLVEGCCPPRPDPLVGLIPHHVRGFAEDKITTIDETVWICDRDHFAIHTLKLTLCLRDGRWLNETGFVDGPAPAEPPF